MRKVNGNSGRTRNHEAFLDAVIVKKREKRKLYEAGPRICTRAGRTGEGRWSKKREMTRRQGKKRRTEGQKRGVVRIG